MAKAVTISRYAGDDRRGDPRLSPFRSCNPSKRYIAAQEMVMKREQELAGLRRLMAKTTSLKTQKILAQRILATKNNLQSWRDYLAEGYERVPGAVIQPRPTKTTTTRRRAA